MKFRDFVEDEVFGRERLARVRAARHGNRMAFESVRDDFKAWRTLTPRHVEAVAYLDGDDGTPEFITAKVAEALEQAGVEAAEVEAFRFEVASSEYVDPLAVCMSWVECVYG